MPLASWLCEEAIRSLPSSEGTHHNSICSWLSHAPSPPPSFKTSRKRSRLCSEQVSNEMSSRDSSPSKRLRLAEPAHSSCATEDVENTPRARSNIAIEPPSPSSFTSSHTTQSSLSRRSRSPKKKQPLRKMANLSLLPNPVLMRSIDDATAVPPNELEDIVLSLKRIGRGLEIIPRSAKVGQSVGVLLAILTNPVEVGCDSAHVPG
jgi:hypothetical protein